MQFIDLKSQYQTIKNQVQSRVNAVLDHGQYIMGPEVKELEAKLAQFVGTKHCIGISSGTDALLAPMMAFGIGHGDEVITTPFTFFATGEMIELLGARCVFVDIDPVTWNIDPAKIEAKITKKTKAIMPVSLYGQTADMDAINAIAKRHNLPVIEDACQSFGASYKGKRSCNLSIVGATSFFPSKPLGCYGDGGAIFTNDDALAEQMRQIMLHGQGPGRYNHVRMGFNGRLDTIQAAILLAKMELFPNEVPLREKVGKRYTELLKGKVKTPTALADRGHVYAQYTIEVDNRDAFAKKMTELGIPTAVHYPKPLHLQPVFDKKYAEGHGAYPISEKAGDHVISLPMYAALSHSDQDQIVKAVLASI